MTPQTLTASPLVHTALERLRTFALRWTGPALGSAFSVAYLALSYSHSHSAVSFLRAPLDLLMAWLMRRRSWRFAGAVWFGVSAFVSVLQGAFLREQPGFLLAAMLGTAAALAQLWPRLRARREDSPMPALPGTWVLLCTLTVVVMDAALLPASGVRASEVRDPLLASGVGALSLFVLLALASHLSHGRWVLHLAAPALVALLRNRLFNHEGSVLDVGTFRDASLVSLPSLAFCLGFDWLRSGDGRTRVLRTFLLGVATALLPVLLADPAQLLHPKNLAVASGRAMAFALCVGLAPRVAGRPSRRFARGRKLGVLPRAALLRHVLIVLAVSALAGLATGHREVSLVALGIGVGTLLLTFFRFRFFRSLGWLAASVPLVALASAVVSSHPGRQDLVIHTAGMISIALVSWLMSSAKLSRHLTRRIRWVQTPLPRVSLAGAGLGFAAAVLAMVHQVQPADRGALLATVHGPVTLSAPLLFQPPTPMESEPSPAYATGSAVASDPLGRGTWVVDEERDEVALVADGGGGRRIPVGGWPEQLVVDATGRVYVSCRAAGRIDVIEPDFRVHSIPVGPEVRPLALDAKRGLLFAGRVVDRELVAVETCSLQVLRRANVTVEPYLLAVTSRGLAVLPRLGGAVLFVSPKLSVRDEVALPATGRRAWHGQALVPMGRDLIVVHAAVDTGLSRPTANGGYGGSVREPVEVVASVLHDGRASPFPPALEARRVLPGAEVSGAAVKRGRLYLAERGSGRLISVSLGALSSPAEGVEEHATGSGLTGVAVDADGTVRTFAAFERQLMAVHEGGGLVKHALGAGVLPAQVARGRALFHQVSPDISASQLACATCHPDGRQDGLVWRLQGMRLQTPSLAGRLADTAPFNWHGTEDTLAGNVKQTIARLGGKGLSPEDTAALAAFLEQGLRRPIRALPPADALVAEGRAIFHDEAVGCSGCHLTEAGGTDGARHDVGSVGSEERREIDQALATSRSEAANARAEALSQSLRGFDTPSLRDVGLTAPYFHDGSVATLEELIARNGDRMGKTSGLTEGQRAALVAYLRTL